MAGGASDALPGQRQSGSAGFPAGGRQRPLATAAGSNYSGQYDGGVVVHNAAGLVSNQVGAHDECNRD
jgi:hypothetical protein